MLAAGALCAAIACSQLEPDFDAVVAIEVAVPDSGFLEMGDTLFPHARPLNGRGDSVGAAVNWAGLDTTVQIVDPATGAAWGKHSGSGRIQASVGTLRSNPVLLVVQPPLDSVRRESEARDTVFRSSVPTDSLSDSLLVRVFAEQPAGLTAAQTLVRRRVTYTWAIFPSTGQVVTLQPNDTTYTNAAGLAIVQVRLDAGLVDSVVLDAHVARHDGSPVPGSPLTFVVEFRP